MRPFMLVCLALVLSFVVPARGQLLLKDGDAVAIAGDSITEQKLYSVYMEQYLLMCRPAAELRSCQFGWGGETAPGFSGRLAHDVLWFKPTVVTTCYGMNDGGYSPMNPEKAKRYRDSHKEIVQKLKQAGVRVIVVGAPGCVDTEYFRKDPTQAAMYNKTLSELRDIAKEVATEEKVYFANVHDAMYEAMLKGKMKHGKEYVFAGGDGFHPGPNGQLMMAYAFLKALGCDGNIGTITVDVGNGSAEASTGHKVIGFANGSAEVESSRYPFCFTGQPGQQSTRSVAEYSSFNQDLNRFTLVVKNAGADKMKVTWGAASKEFAAADLEKGINLAAEFMDGNPFAMPFEQAAKRIRDKQNYETPLHKQLFHQLSPMRATVRAMVPEEAESVDRILQSAAKRQKDMSAAASAAVTPVKHVIKVEAVK